MELTKAQCNELRGLAILSIVLHNFFHQERFGFAQQNEGSFDLGRTADFLAGLGDGLGNALCEISSFLGWLGVPVFVFLSGYGLARKYESSPAGSLAVLPHIKHSWLKLFKLMLPGVLFCAVFMQMSGYGGAGAMARYAVYLSLLGNLAGMPAPTPGVYWYFGLTFELYVCYILFERYRDRRILLAGFVLPLLLQFFLLLTGKDGLLNYNLNNLVGWLPVFVTGIGAARLRRENGNPRNNAILPVLLLAVSSALLVACNLSRWGWGVIHFVALAFFFALTNLVDRVGPLRRVFGFLGSWGSYLFVGHPIARLVAKSIHPGALSIGCEFLLYLVLLVAVVIVYRLIHQKVLSFIKT